MTTRYLFPSTGTYTIEMENYSLEYGNDTYMVVMDTSNANGDT